MTDQQAAPAALQHQGLSGFLLAILGQARLQTLIGWCLATEQALAIGLRFLHDRFLIGPAIFYWTGQHGTQGRPVINVRRCRQPSCGAAYRDPAGDSESRAVAATVIAIPTSCARSTIG